MIDLPNELLDFLLSESSAELRMDINVWISHYENNLSKRFEVGSTEDRFLALIISYPEFRNLLDYRVRVSGFFDSPIRFFKDLSRANDLNFNLAKLGGGAFVQHGNSTWIFAKSIGKNLFINQNVTIGQGRGGAPVIGDNVVIRTGAVVVGAISIGSNVMIGANAVVNFDVPDNSRVYAPRSLLVTNAS
jgi:serine O-acetyltransferase